ncbi:MAG: calcium/sodium antiporter [Bacteroidetes bacterium]|nr:calcium/sodium antiporter [Bacteroidota bacterium]HET6245266.1 calcium/sodium antiporter [Bacteroidia bacterium]
MEYLLLIVGLAILISGGEILVKGAVAIALKFNVSVLVIGMTIVSFGTSAPELLVSIKAAIQGHPDISIGNVIGSNIANISLILGVTTIIFPILINKDSLKIDWPMMMVSSMIFYLFLLNNLIGFYEGLFLFLFLILFNFWIIYKSRKEHKKIPKNDEPELIPEVTTPIWKSLLFILLGVLGLILGAEWFLNGAVGIAENFGISERIIAITVVAFGTSVPELVTSGIAALKKQTDISIGNLIGSNIFNLLGILGITAMVKEIPISIEMANFDIYWMLGISLLIFPLMYFGRKIGRLKGLVLVSFYLVYIFIVIN